MAKNLKNFEILLRLEKGAEETYGSYIKYVKDHNFVKDIAHVRDEEKEHILLVQELLSILSSQKSVLTIKKKAVSPYWLKDRAKLVLAAKKILDAKIKLIFSLEKLDALNLKLKELNKLKSEFVSITAHQIRGPLTSMKWLFDAMINRELGKLNPKQKSLIKDIYSSNEKLVNLVNDLLKVSKLEEVKSEEKLKRVNLALFLNGILQKYQPIIHDKQIKVLSPALKSLEIKTAPGLLENVLDNLISNAVKYTLQNGQIKITLEIKKRYIFGRVADTGIGISEEDKNQIFKKFYRSKTAKEISPEGSGLGLNIAKNSIEKLGGRIWFESNQPKGTIFYFELPLKIK